MANGVKIQQSVQLRVALVQVFESFISNHNCNKTLIKNTQMIERI